MGVVVAVLRFVLDVFNAVERSPDRSQVAVELSSATARSFLVTEVLVAAAAMLAILIVSKITRCQRLPPLASFAGAVDAGRTAPARPDLG